MVAILLWSDGNSQSLKKAARVEDRRNHNLGDFGVWRYSPFKTSCTTPTEGLLIAAKEGALELREERACSGSHFVCVC